MADDTTRTSIKGTSSCNTCSGASPGVITTKWEPQSFAANVQDFWCPYSSSRPEIPILQQPPTPLEFCRDFVRASRPCIVRNAILDPRPPRNNKGQHQPLYLTLDDIIERFDSNDGDYSEKNKENAIYLSVDVTPDGHGDCVRRVVVQNDGKGINESSSLMFVQPQQCYMSLKEFRDRLRRQSKIKQTSPITDPLDQCPYDINGLPSIPVASAATTTVRPIDLPDRSIVYYSRQNDCLRTREKADDQEENNASTTSTTSKDIADLASLFPSGFDWAQQAFGTSMPLDAVNLWMGNEKSVSSMHKDHYENLFYVASGEKIFTVCPPADVPFLYQHVVYPSGRFEIALETSECEDVDTTPSWAVRPFSSTTNNRDHEGSCSEVRWIYPDLSPLLSPGDQEGAPRSRLLQEFPLLRHAHPMEIRVQAGELLYLPSLWFHRVTQSCETIGVNYWYDMNFVTNPLWCYFQLLQEMRLVKTVSN